LSSAIFPKNVLFHLPANIGNIKQNLFSIN
jgi:hypothetical protein